MVKRRVSGMFFSVLLIAPGVLFMWINPMWSRALCAELGGARGWVALGAALLAATWRMRPWEAKRASARASWLG